MLISYWLSQTQPVALRIHELVLFGSILLPDSKETELGSSNQKAATSSKNFRLVIVACRTWKFFSTAISGDVDISEVSGCYLWRYVSSK